MNGLYQSKELISCVVKFHAVNCSGYPFNIGDIGTQMREARHGQYVVNGRVLANHERSSRVSAKSTLGVKLCLQSTPALSVSKVRARGSLEIAVFTEREGAVLSERRQGTGPATITKSGLYALKVAPSATCGYFRLAIRAVRNLRILNFIGSAYPANAQGFKFLSSAVGQSVAPGLTFGAVALPIEGFLSATLAAILRFKRSAVMVLKEPALVCYTSFSHAFHPLVMNEFG